MFKTYQAIFSQRGQDYHQAMLDCPSAREQEFEAIIGLADLSEGQLVLDIPSGGGYLGNYLSVPANLVAVETSHEFARNLQPTETLSLVLCHDLTDIFLPAACADRIISLAGLHHLDDKPAFFREAFRLLKPGGVLCVADAHEHSAVAGFLNGFVDANNSMGHRGVFFDDATGTSLASVGFEVRCDEIKRYSWQFDDRMQMATYCKRLFGMDLASPSQVLTGIEEYLGYTEQEARCDMHWELQFFKCLKR